MMATRAVHLKAKILMMRWALPAPDVDHLVERLFYDKSEDEKDTLRHRYESWERKSIKSSLDEEIFARFTPHCVGDISSLTLMSCDPWRFLRSLNENVVLDFLARSDDEAAVDDICSFAPARDRSFITAARLNHSNPAAATAPPVSMALLAPELRTVPPADYLAFNVDLEAHEGDVHRDWLREGVVDQRFMYVSREAVDQWNAIVNSQEYQTYFHCEGALRRLVRDSSWKTIVEANQLDTIVILGAGAPSKDMIIINNLLSVSTYNASRKLRVIIFDSSFYMLIDTVRDIGALLNRLKKRDSVELIPCCADFMNLKAWAQCIRPLYCKERVAFFILGGTIGNVEEETLFDALQSVSRDGDMLIIGAEFGDVYSDEYRGQLLKVYDQESTRELALNAIRFLLDNDGFSRLRHDRLSLVGVAIQNAEALPGKLKSHIHGTIAVVFQTLEEIGVSEGLSSHLVLVTAKRYDEPAFIDTCEKDGFILIKPKFCSPDTEQYKLLMFEKRSPTHSKDAAS